MSLWDRIDAESKPALDILWEALPGGLNGIPDIVARRAAHEAFQAAAPKGEFPNLNVSDHSYAGPDGDLSLRLYQPKGATVPAPGLIYIHGGGMIMGNLESQDEVLKVTASELGIPIASIDYRKAPEHPYPAAPEDCFAGVCWVFENAAALGMDTNNIGLMGASAGGGLALATALMLRDREGPRLKYLLPIYPMIERALLKPGTGTSAIRHPTPMPHRPEQRICRGYHPPTSMWATSTCFGMRTS